MFDGQGGVGGILRFYWKERTACSSRKWTLIVGLKTDFFYTSFSLTISPTL